MFTGIIEAVGRVARVDERGGGRALVIAAQSMIDGMRVGDSIAVNGCCLTAIRVEGDDFEVEMVPETLARTTLGRLSPGDGVNLERSLRAVIKAEVANGNLARTPCLLVQGRRGGSGLHDGGERGHARHAMQRGFRGGFRRVTAM